MGLFFQLIIGLLVFFLTNNIHEALWLSFMLLFGDIILFASLIYYFFFTDEVSKYILDLVHKFVEFDYIDGKVNDYIGLLNNMIELFIKENAISSFISHYYWGGFY